MASPVDTFKSSLFGQLKSYGDAVQGVFEQRIGKHNVRLACATENSNLIFCNYFPEPLT